MFEACCHGKMSIADLFDLIVLLVYKCESSSHLSLKGWGVANGLLMVHCLNKSPALFIKFVYIHTFVFSF